MTAAYYFTLPISERRIVVVRPDTRVEAHALNNLLCVQALAFSVGVQFIEVRNSQGKISVSKQFYCFRLSEAHEQRVDVLLNRAFLEQFSESMCCLCQLFILRIRSHDDSAGIQIIV